MNRDQTNPKKNDQAAAPAKASAAPTSAPAPKAYSGPSVDTRAAGDLKALVTEANASTGFVGLP